MFLEMVANYVLIIVAQHQVEKQYDAEPEEEKFFRIQRDLTEDTQVTYFEAEPTLVPDVVEVRE